MSTRQYGKLGYHVTIAMMLALTVSPALGQNSHAGVWYYGATQNHSYSANELSASSKDTAEAAVDLGIDPAKLPPAHVTDAPFSQQTSLPAQMQYFQALANLEQTKRNEQKAKDMLRRVVPTKRPFGESDSAFQARTKATRDKVQALLNAYTQEEKKLQVSIDELLPQATSGKLATRSATQLRNSNALTRVDQAQQDLKAAEAKAPPIPTHAAYGESEADFHARVAATKAQRDSILDPYKKELDDAQQKLSQYGLR